MSRETADWIAIALWMIGLAAVTLLMQWLGAVSNTWGWFFAAYFVLAVLTLGFEIFQRWIRRMLHRPDESGNAVPPPQR